MGALFVLCVLICSLFNGAAIAAFGIGCENLNLPADQPDFWTQGITFSSSTDVSWAVVNYSPSMASGNVYFIFFYLD